MGGGSLALPTMLFGNNAWWFLKYKHKQYPAWEDLYIADEVAIEIALIPEISE